MLEKGSWSHTPEGVFSCDSDSYVELKRLTSDDTDMSGHCFKSSNMDCGGDELCTDDTLLRDKSVVEDGTVSQYPINQMSQDDNEFSFLDSDGWLDIENFEDVDRMLNYDLTFGMGSLNNEEEFCWLSSSRDAEGSDDALKSDFKFSCAEISPLESMSDYDMGSKEDIKGLPINDSNKTLSSADRKVRSQMDVDDNGIPPTSFNESGKKSSNTADLVPKEKRKMAKSLAGRQKNSYLENDDSIHQYTPLEQYEDIHQHFGASSSGITSVDSIQKQKLSSDSDPLGCMQTQIPLMHLDLSQTPNHTSLFPTLSKSRSKQSEHPSASLKESSCASNMESSHGHSLEAATLKSDEKGEKLYPCHDKHTLSRSVKSDSVSREMPFCGPGSAQKVDNQFENENEGHSEVHGVRIGFSPEIDSSTVQESSSMSSALNGNSLEANSFCQLQQVMDQLDIRTKLCLRDSLYRLAKSAEQRHNDSIANGCTGDDQACKSMVPHNGSRCMGFMDMETDTNPIDRSIAHLLFHRPHDQSMSHPYDTMPFKSSATIHESLINSPVKTEKHVCLEDSSTGVGKKTVGVKTEKNSKL
ncbi:hypothetical protein Ahy_B10g101271 isoform J [Arachis hypogaea]|uniref:Protein LNK1 n=1 Tax=Arachis hypogaea TaxID=3818 RepID=A0A444WZ55_ARAHY|nr:hypothetical protein Ahy_B10g101271 isoform J [Arachis hypogaea]